MVYPPKTSLPCWRSSSPVEAAPELFDRHLSQRSMKSQNQIHEQQHEYYL